jgi:hypothetical protein
MATAVSGSISAVELVKILIFVKDAIEQFYQADKEFKKYSRKFDDLDAFLQRIQAHCQSLIWFDSVPKLILSLAT